MRKGVFAELTQLPGSRVIAAFLPECAASWKPAVSGPLLPNVPDEGQKEVGDVRAEVPDGAAALPGLEERAHT